MQKKTRSGRVLHYTKTETDYMSAIRTNLGEFVDDKDITINDIAEAADVSPDTVKSILYSRSADCKLSTTISLAKALGMTLDEFAGSGTVDPITAESLKIAKHFSQNDLYLVRWFIRHIESRNRETPPGKTIVNIMRPMCAEGNLRSTNEWDSVDITELPDAVRRKIFFGVRVPCEHYAPIYFPGAVLLVANDRNPRNDEHCIITAGSDMYIAKYLHEPDGANYYSVVNGRFKACHADIDEIVGYVVHVM